MKQINYTLKFITPAFMGNANQSGQWRTPPFKALLRQWWRISVAERLGYCVDELRKQEACLFGTAADGDNSRKSQVRIRLQRWDEGRLREAPAVSNITLGRNSVGGALYSGYGPIQFESGSLKLNADAAIGAGELNTLQLAVPAHSASAIEHALALMHGYGTVGGRSRNGWGSFELSNTEHPIQNINLPMRPWQDALQLDWPHAIGTDGSGPLVWQSNHVLDRWEDAIHLLAQIRAEMRRKVSDRLLLAYPSTRATFKDWDKKDRVPHSLRFKVRSQDGKFVALAFHIPCRPAEHLWRKLSFNKQQQFAEVFAQAHQYLDNHKKLARAEV